MSLFISPNTPEGLQGERNASLTYLYGLSDYWVNIFEDVELVESVLEVHTHQLSDVYGKFLQLTGNVSLQTIQEEYNTQIDLLLIDRADAVDSLVGTTFKLKKPIRNCKYLMNRPLLPTETLEQGVHYELSSDGTRITFFKPLRELPFPKRPTRSGSEEYALWASNVQVDEDLIQKEYGALVDMTPEKAIGNYKAFLQGMYFLYSHGPNINHIERGLNLSLGLPYARTTESVLSIIQDGGTGHWIVITGTQYYDIPYGFQPDLKEGDVIYAGQQLASWVEVRDFRKNGDWWINGYIPQELLHDVDSFDLGPAFEGSAADHLMREYLKNHTFQVLFKQSGVSLDAYNTVRDIVFRAKPSYTYPVFVWQAPIGDEVIDLHEDFKYNLKSDIQDYVGIQPIDGFRRDTPNNGFTRGQNWYNRFQVPFYVQRMMGDSPDPMDIIGDTREDEVLSGVGGWVPDIQYVDNYQQAWLGKAMRNRGDITTTRTRSTGIRGYRSVNADTFYAMTWKVPGNQCYPIKREPFEFLETNLTPLYLANDTEIQEKMRKVQVAFDISRGDIQVLFDIDLKSNYETVIKRNFGKAIAVADRDPRKEQAHDFYFTEGSLNPTLSEYQTQAYLPPITSVSAKGIVVVAKVFRDVWAVYVLRTELQQAPAYFPIDNDDTIELTAEFDYAQLDPETRPALINRSTAKLESHFLMDRARADGLYNDVRSGYVLTMNRSGVYGPLDQPLRSYKRA